MIGQRKNTAADIVVVGFALFSMFFGAGNVIFPPFLGMEAGSQWLTGFSTYFIADIGLAMMGMFALLRVGAARRYWNGGQSPRRDPHVRHHSVYRPHGGHPRTSASTYEMAIAPNLSGVSPVVFSVVFFAVILALCIKESAVVDIVGKVLTPLLLVGLFAIIIKGVITPLGDIAPLAQIDNVAVTGIKAGYQTMDALAACPSASSCCKALPPRAISGAGASFAWWAAPRCWRACCCWRCIWVWPIWAPPCPHSTRPPSAARPSSWPS